MGVFANARKNRQSVQIHGDGEQRRDFIHVKDVANANLAGLEMSGSGFTYNVGSGTNVSINELAKLFNLRTSYIERRVGDAESTLADISATILDLGWEPKIALLTGIRDL
jgi:UDP-glucose 4-epimerase